jgi:hypothetical protein
MATYFESGVGKGVLHTDSTNSAGLGRLAASEALSQIKRFEPSLALAFFPRNWKSSKYLKAWPMFWVTVL